MTPHKTPHILGHSNECFYECPAAVCPFLSNCDGVEQVYPLGRVELGPITPTERERGTNVHGRGGGGGKVSYSPWHDYLHDYLHKGITPVGAADS